MNNLENQYKYDVAFSFAGAQREYVEQVNNTLKGYNISVFYDNDNNVELWGKNLYRYLDDLYSTKARYCVIFISKEYAERPWTIHESQAAQERSFSSYDSNDFQEYILPVRFDDTVIPGIRLTTGYMDANRITPQELARYIANKVKPDCVFDSGKETIDTIYEFIVSVAINFIDNNFSFCYKKENNNLKIFLDSSEQSDLITIRNYKNYIHMYIGEYSLEENPTIVIFVNQKDLLNPIKIINFSHYFTQLPEFSADFVTFKRIIKDGLKKFFEAKNDII